MNEQERELQSPALAARNHVSPSRHIADIAAKLDFPTALVLKDPNLVQFNAEASAVFPEAIRIVSIRDPRDIAASFLRIGQRGAASRQRQ